MMCGVQHYLVLIFPIGPGRLRWPMDAFCGSVKHFESSRAYRAHLQLALRI